MSDSDSFMAIIQFVDEYLCRVHNFYVLFVLCVCVCVSFVLF